MKNIKTDFKFPTYAYPEIFINRYGIIIQATSEKAVVNQKEFPARKLFSGDFNEHVFEKSEFIPFKGTITVC